MMNLPYDKSTSVIGELRRDMKSWVEYWWREYVYLWCSDVNEDHVYL